MNIKAIQTGILNPPKDDLFHALKHAIHSLEERSVLVVTSKVSIHEGRCIKIEDVEQKDTLVHAEADMVLPLSYTPDRKSLFTIKNNLFVVGAGIDKSNGNGHNILLPEDPMASALRIQAWAKEVYGVHELGVIITDSYSTPLRRGASVASIGFAGIAPLTDYRGEKDIFGRDFQFEVRNVIDGFASSGGVVMGEGGEMSPVALITDMPNTISFNEASLRDDLVFFLNADSDRFGFLYRDLPWE